jgi:RNA polymerase sigma factor (sigma-70 family)
MNVITWLANLGRHRSLPPVAPATETIADRIFGELEAAPMPPKLAEFVASLHEQADHCCAEPISKEVEQRMAAAVNQLSNRQKRIMQLHVKDGLTYRQVAARLGLTDKAVLRELSDIYTTLRFVDRGIGR